MEQLDQKSYIGDPKRMRFLFVDCAFAMARPDFSFAWAELQELGPKPIYDSDGRRSGKLEGQSGRRRNDDGGAYLNADVRHGEHQRVQVAILSVTLADMWTRHIPSRHQPLRLR